MNGFTLWVLLAATGQVGGVAERDFGWQINPNDRKLEYVVQISPQDASYMSTAGKEFESDVPPEVAARLSRVVVRISDVPLVSTPMEEVMRLPPVTTAVLANIEAIAGRGRFSQLESGPSGDVLNVNGSGLPSAPGTSLSDQTRTLGTDSLLAQNSGSNSFPNDPRNLNQGPLNQGALNQGAGTTPNKYANTGSPTIGLPPNQSPSAQSGIVGPQLPSSNYPTSPTNTQGNTSGLQNSGIGNSGIGTNHSAPSSYPGIGVPAGTTSSQPYNSPYANQGYTMPTTTSPFGQTPGYNNPATNSGNFATLPSNGNSHQLPYNQYATLGTGPGAPNTQHPYAQNQYGQSPYAQSPYAQSPYAQSPTNTGVGSSYPDPLSLPSYPQQPPRIADSRASITVPSTSTASTGLGTGSTSGFANTTSTGRDSSALDDQYASQYNNARSGVNNIVPVMFVLSLVVNFYLGMLIRKLLTRYRSLLSSVRGQAAL